MNINFHYGVIYVTSRLAVLSPSDAQVVAHACQYVDDATTDEGSWKHAATGIAAVHDGLSSPTWTPAFESSHYRKFHDATKEHRFVVTQEILPAFNVRLA